jgi:hypothetical protein
VTVTHLRAAGVPQPGATMYRKSWEDWFIIIGTLATVAWLGGTL